MGQLRSEERVMFDPFDGCQDNKVWHVDLVIFCNKNGRPVSREVGELQIGDNGWTFAGKGGGVKLSGDFEGDWQKKAKQAIANHYDDQKDEELIRFEPFEGLETRLWRVRVALFDLDGSPAPWQVGIFHLQKEHWLYINGVKEKFTLSGDFEGDWQKKAKQAIAEALVNKGIRYER